MLCLMDRRMKGLAELTKTTLIGGLLVVLPIYLSILLVARSLSAHRRATVAGHGGDPGRRAVPADPRHRDRARRLPGGWTRGPHRSRAAGRARA